MAGFAGDAATTNGPIPIFLIRSPDHKYLLYDADTVIWLRKSHRILGVLIGSLPQFPQQNVFQGLPLQLQNEEARLLCEKGIAFIVDDLTIHVHHLSSLNIDVRERFSNELEQQGAKLAQINATSKEQKSLKHRIKNQQKRSKVGEDPAGLTEDDESMFKSRTQQDCAAQSPSSTSSKGYHAYAMTPAASYPPLLAPSPETQKQFPAVNLASYALFKYLYERSYVLSPGLRFGCRFLVYPGDPLRYHSHFLANSYDWDQEIDLLDIISGGRLGTGVKKSFLISGTDLIDKKSGVHAEHQGDYVEHHNRTRTFCIEWGGM